MEQLRARPAAIAVIAQQCGFYDQAHFTRSFSRLMGVTPSAFRKDRARLTVTPSRAREAA